MGDLRHEGSGAVLFPLRCVMPVLGRRISLPWVDGQLGPAVTAPRAERRPRALGAPSLRSVSHAPVAASIEDGDGSTAVGLRLRKKHMLHCRGRCSKVQTGHAPSLLVHFALDIEVLVRNLHRNS